MSTGKHYKFGPFVFACATCTVWRDGEPVQLSPRAAATLGVLLDDAGQIVSREAAITRVYGGTNVEPGNLDHNIYIVRRTLGTDADGNDYIETHPRRGYRFRAAVEVVEETELRAAEAVPKANGTADTVTTTEAAEDQQRAEAEEKHGSTSREDDPGAAVVGSPSLDPEITPAISRQHDLPAQQPAAARRTASRWTIPLAILILMIVSALAVLAFRYAPLPSVVRYTRLTDDRYPKWNAVFTDGPRLYFGEDNETGRSLRVVSIPGGDSIPVPGFPAHFAPLDISPDGSAVLGIVIDHESSPWQLWSIPLAGGSPRAFGQVLADDAAWSPDGSHIVYARDGGLYMLDPADLRSWQLKQFAQLPKHPHWSRDGAKIRFVLTPLEHAKPKSLWEVGADGSSAHEVELGKGFAGAIYAGYSGAWSPDGRFYYFCVSLGDRIGIWVRREARWPLPASAPKLLTNMPGDFGSLVPSRDGKKLFALFNEHRGELVRYDARLQEWAPYLNGISAHWVIFSPDQQWVAYIRWPENTLWRANADGSQPVQLTFAPLETAGLAWSPDSKQIAVRGRWPGGVWKIYLVGRNGGQLRELTTGTNDEGIPTWSPDGKKIAFGEIPARWNQGTGQETVHVYDLERRQLSTFPQSEGLWSTRWSPDGRYLAALTTTGQHLYLYDFALGHWRAARFERGVDEMIWSRDGRYLCIETMGVRTIFRFYVDDDRVEHVVDVERYSRAKFWTGLALDGSPLVVRDIGNQEIYALDLQIP